MVSDYIPPYKTACPWNYGILKQYARQNRKNPTLAELALWQYLGNKSLGHKFLRQHIIGDYIVDFLCCDDGLVIEVDGAYHSEPRQAEDDEIRTRWLESQGYHVMRFSNEEVLNETDRVIDEIYDYFE